jgi:hypothetical protein
MAHALGIEAFLLFDTFFHGEFFSMALRPCNATQTALTHVFPFYHNYDGNPTKVVATDTQAPRCTKAHVEGNTF